MNETRNRIISYLLVFILGAGISAASIHFTIVGPGIRAAEQLRTELRSAQDDNSRLAESVRVRQEALGRASEIIRGSDTSISKLRGILEVLREAEQASEDRSSNAVGNSSH